MHNDDDSLRQLPEVAMLPTSVVTVAATGTLCFLQPHYKITQHILYHRFQIFDIITC